LTVETDNHAIRGFAKSAIAAAALINSGAMLASLNQITALKSTIAVGSLQTAFYAWGGGLAVATLCWVIAYLTASAYAHNLRRVELALGVVGVLGVVASIALFLRGIVSIARGLI